MSSGKIDHVVLDRDGTLIRHIPYLSDPGQVELLPTVMEGVAELLEAGCKLYLHTNQSGIGRGYFALEEAQACNDSLLKLLGKGEGLFEEICICPETPDQEAVYRKPSPRFGLEIMQKAGIGSERLCYVGDNLSDLVTAKNLGCMGVGVGTGLHDVRQLLGEQGLAEAFPVFDSFLEAARYIIGHGG